MLLDVFRSRYKSAIYAKVFKEEIKYKLRCYGFVYFSDGSEISKAISEMHEATIMGRRIKTGPGLKIPSKATEKPNLNAIKPVSKLDIALLEEFANQKLPDFQSDYTDGLKQVKTATVNTSDQIQIQSYPKSVQFRGLTGNSDLMNEEFDKKESAFSFNLTKNDSKLSKTQNSKQRDLLDVI